MVDIIDSAGRNILCEWYNHELTLSYKTNYQKCVNCGGKYNDPNKELWVFKSFYNWYYYKQLI